MVDQYRDLADARLSVGCTYCDGVEETVDHVPSKVFLDEPFPANLPVVPACKECNRGFAKDEEYVACVLEAVLVGSTDPEAIRRPRVARALRHSEALRAIISAGRTEEAGKISWHVDGGRLRNVVLKLARGHAAFEQSQRMRVDPSVYVVCPLQLLTPEERSAFEAPDLLELWGEVGSRAMQRTSVVQLDLRHADGTISSTRFAYNDWIEVQPEQYRYLTAVGHDGILVRIVLGGFLACEVIWRDAE